MNLLNEISFILLIMAVAINSLLAYIVYDSNVKSSTNKLYAVLSLNISVWLIANYISVNPLFLTESLLWIRLSFFSAIPMSMLFFLLAYTIPLDEIPIRRRTVYLIYILTALDMLFLISPYAITGVTIDTGSPKPIPGPGLLSFAVLSTLFSALAVYTLISKYQKSVGVMKEQYRFVMYGILLMLGLIIVTIFVPAVVLGSGALISLLPIYTLIFLGMTAYAIVKFHLFNLKVIATQAFTVLLWILFFSRIFIATSIADRLVSIIIFIATVIFGYLLIRSVQQEVKQREQLEVLTKKLEEANVQLQALDKARAEFITIASHQLRTPPATIKWYLASIIGGDFGAMSNDIKEQLTRIQVTNNALIALIDDLLNVSRIERGKLEFIFESTDLLAITQLTVDQLVPQAEMKGLKLFFNKPQAALPTFTADKEKLRQVINNLIDNAIKYTKQGSVTVDIGMDEKNYFVKIKDTGRGVSPEQAKHIFEKFDRGKTAPGNSTGLGLGLYVAKVIVEQHNGKLWAESEGEGKGSIFQFTIPVKNKLENTVFDLTKNQANITPKA